jgi:hypothetical protein
VTVKPQWRAAADGIGHLVLKPQAFNAVCGRRAVLERLSHPVTTKCRVCLAAVGEVVPAA